MFSKNGPSKEFSRFSEIFVFVFDFRWPAASRTTTTDVNFGLYHWWRNINKYTVRYHGCLAVAGQCCYRFHRGGGNGAPRDDDGRHSYQRHRKGTERYCYCGGENTIYYNIPSRCRIIVRRVAVFYSDNLPGGPDIKRHYQLSLLSTRVSRIFSVFIRRRCSYCTCYTTTVYWVEW